MAHPKVHKAPKPSKPVPKTPTVPKAAAEPTPSTQKRSPSEVRRDVEQYLDTHARQYAEKHGLAYHTAYACYLATAHGQELYRLYCELPVGPLPQPETTPAQFTQPRETGAWAEIERLGQKKVETGECKTLAEATTRVLNEQPKLYEKYVAGNR